MSDSDENVTFNFFQPADDAEESRHDGSQKVLVVDDMRTNVDMLTSLCKAEADHVVTAMSGEEALEVAIDEKPDLILLDIIMPGMDGFETCWRLKAKEATADVPIVFITGKTDIDQEEKGLNLGAIDYIRKPFSPSIVRARVRNLLSYQRMASELRRLATTDPLTGAFNRRYFLDALGAEAKRCDRHGRVLSLVMMDIDHFKSINDTHGHDVGDEALIALVAKVKETIRDHDVFGRLGGEEFALLLPETPMDGAALLAERLREAIAAIQVETPSGLLSYTCSMGVSERSASEPQVSLFKRADDALYEAKQSGRNRVIQAPPFTP